MVVSKLLPHYVMLLQQILKCVLLTFNCGLEPVLRLFRIIQHIHDAQCCFAGFADKQNICGVPFCGCLKNGFLSLFTFRKKNEANALIFVCPKSSRPAVAFLCALKHVVSASTSFPSRCFVHFIFAYTRSVRKVTSLWWKKKNRHHWSAGNLIPLKAVSLGLQTFLLAVLPFLEAF